MNIIFDFDGTIADTLDVVVGIYKDMQPDAPAPSAHEIGRLRNMSLSQVAAELRVRPWKVPFLLARGRKLMRSQMTRVQAFPGILAVIKQLAADGHRLYIMSSNSVQNILLFLHQHDMNTEFIKIYGGVRIFGKARVLKRVVRHNRLRPEDTWYIGDEVRDIEAAQHVGVHVAAVTWGYNSPKILEKHQPDVMVAKPAELKTLGLKVLQ